ncbi:MAG TPA: hypothetical protein VFH99_00390 [Candidatus Saccharimonadales bacterium]|nr:hypothetical protein [Candidatus Saccharimonadales bacterium]
MSAFRSLEKNLDDWLVKQAPPLPPNAKRTLVEYLPWINLILGVLTLYSVYIIWHWAHLANNFINYANSVGAAYGAPQIAANRLTFGIWLGLVVLAAEALLYLAAFPATRDRKKSGWDLMFYAFLVNVAYGVVILFTAYGGFGSLIWTLIGSAIGLYLLFQIRGNYKATTARSRPAASKPVKNA